MSPVPVQMWSRQLRGQLHSLPAPFFPLCLRSDAECRRVGWLPCAQATYNIRRATITWHTTCNIQHTTWPTARGLCRRAVTQSEPTTRPMPLRRAPPPATRPSANAARTTVRPQSARCTRAACVTRGMRLSTVLRSSCCTAGPVPPRRAGSSPPRRSMRSPQRPRARRGRSAVLRGSCASPSCARRCRSLCHRRRIAACCAAIVNVACCAPRAGAPRWRATMASCVFAAAT